MRAILLAAFGALALGVSVPTFANMAPPPEAIAERMVREADAEFNTAIANKDVTKIVSFYGADANILPPGSPPIQGHDNIVAFWTSFTGDPSSTLVAEIIRVKVSEGGDVAIMQGAYTFTSGEGAAKKVEQGKFVVTWAMTNEGWKIYTDMFSPNAPADVQTSGTNAPAEQMAPPATPAKSE